MTVAPLTPDDIRQRTDAAVDQCVKYINDLLTMDAAVSLLRSDQAVNIFDSSGAQMWKAGAPAAVELFKKAGWRVTEFYSIKFGTVYEFWLSDEGASE